MKWGLEPELQFLRQVANFVYEGELAGRPVVVRLTEPSRRGAQDIEAELDWMDFLARQGIQLARPIRSMRGLFVEQVEGAPPFFAAIFEKAQGVSLSGGPIDAGFAETWGRYLGRMHRLTKGYRPPTTLAPRQSWEGDDALKTALRALDPADALPFRRMNELLAWLKGLPQNRAEYGLVHADLHSGNFFVHEGAITAFDFDDSCYHWFAYDLVIPMISMNLQDRKPGLLSDLALREPFLNAYLSENSLSQIWIDRLELFGKYRAALIYHWTKAGMAEGRFDEKGLEWCRLRMPGWLEQIKEPLELV